MLYQFTDEQWTDAKESLAREMMKMNNPDQPDFELEDYTNAEDTIDNCFAGEEFFTGVQNTIEEMSIRNVAKEMVNSFCPTDDMGEYVERHSIVLSLLNQTFETYSTVL